MGWLSLGAIIFFSCRYDLLGRIIAANAFFLVFIIFGALILGVLAIYGVMNSWRLLGAEQRLVRPTTSILAGAAG